ncbi:glycoside hydrolase family 15 protein, partial [Microbacteriaceae bacterium K1510]|nr:glycoside hydrolase family 15 protein [Microbacteriaceae bacterium K1510]
FIANAMDRVGEHESARRFYLWCGEVINKHKQKAKGAIAAVAAGITIRDADELFLHTRYTTGGEEVQGKWGNFQLDGYGAWLWGLAQHVKLTGDLPLITTLRPAIELTVDYLQSCWQLPHFDCWEEGGNDIYLSTLAAVYGGCKAITSYLPERA